MSTPIRYTLPAGWAPAATGAASKAAKAVTNERRFRSTPTVPRGAVKGQAPPRRQYRARRRSCWNIAQRGT